MSKETRLRPLPNYNEQIHTLEHAVQELRDKVQKLKHGIQGMEIHSLECKKMLQDNYDRYDPRAISSKKDRVDKVMRGNHDVDKWEKERKKQEDKWEKERKKQEDEAWQRFLHTPYGNGSAQAKKYTRHWLNTHYRSKFFQPLFKSSKYMDEGATNPYVILTADDTWKPVQVFETKIETLTQQVSELEQVVSEWSQKQEQLYHDYLNMKNTLNYQKEHYGLPQAPL